MIIKTKAVFEYGSKIIYEGKKYIVVRQLRMVKPTKNKDVYHTVLRKARRLK